jgi:hypothetical protein
MANFTSAVLALVGERDHVFLVSVAEKYNLPYEELSKLYLETAEGAIKVPRKYTKKVASATTVVEGTAEPKAKVVKEPKAKAEKTKCTACTSKKEPCKFSALKGEVFCKRHLRGADGETVPKDKAAKKPAKSEQPVHTHPLTEKATEVCDLCESHGNPLATEVDFEVVTVESRLAALLEGAESEPESEPESEIDPEMVIGEEAFEDD